MKISTRGRYGIRLLIDLAEHTSDHVTLASIAERQNISLRYLEQVVVILRRAGFIRSVKGASGGYMLAIPSDKIRIGDALRALEGDMLVNDPPNDTSKESRYARSVRVTVFEPLNERIAAVIDEQTLSAIVDSADNQQLMYFI